ncbi:hypothetical protein JSE7799_00962 [Jannaschia seosinensis]|uniref:Lysozyme inhibitor LprI N-terminal domain-containing protein n=1 Tax=Jannaschia seosinensis TaxID=313367 RepID=A0A0M7B642_9RHOB|nr:hypothetical protein [Jannaschia seosinensis]CUH33014.1 hypothetical protein JSE7799_00962 [Jannaschia seosinensis]
MRVLALLALLLPVPALAQDDPAACVIETAGTAGAEQACLREALARCDTAPATACVVQASQTLSERAAAVAGTFSADMVDAAAARLPEAEGNRLVEAYRLYLKEDGTGACADGDLERDLMTHLSEEVSAGAVCELLAETARLRAITAVADVVHDVLGPR